MAPSLVASLLDSIDNSPALGVPPPSAMESRSWVDHLRTTDSISPRLCDKLSKKSIPRYKHVRTFRFSPDRPSSLSKTIEQPSTQVDYLDALPIEILQMIETNLSRAQKGALVLCSKSIFSKLGGDKVLEKLKCGLPEVFAWNGRATGMCLEHQIDTSRRMAKRMDFLALLLKDFQQPMKLCRFCQKLHKPEEKVKWPTDVEKSEYSNRGAALAYGIPHAHMQKAIGCWMIFRPLPQAEIDGYLQSWNVVLDGGYERSFMGYVVDGQYFLRTEHVISVPEPITSEPPDTFRNINLCSITHCASLLRVREARLRERLRCRLRHEVKNEDTCEACSGVKRCDECYTDSEIELRESEMGSGVRKLVLTTWQVFGVGVTPFQSKFAKTRDEDGNRRLRLFRAGCIKEIFDTAREEAMEGQDDSSAGRIS